MPDHWATMVLEGIPSLKLVMMTAMMASKKATSGPSPEEVALRQIEGKIMAFWDLMRRHSKDPSGVAYKAYEGLHLRISKSLSGSFSTDMAMTVSRQDWKADSVQTSVKLPRGQERSIIDDVKHRFRAASYKLGSTDWLKLFQQYDKDGNGELDEEEFAMAVRKYIHKDKLSDAELKLLFRDVDEDGGGTIDASEFEAFFFQGTLNQNQFFGSMWELAELWAMEDADGADADMINPIRDGDKFCAFLSDIYDNVSTQALSAVASGFCNVSDRLLVRADHRNEDQTRRRHDRQGQRRE